MVEPVFDGRLGVMYHQAYFGTGQEEPGFDGAFRQQSNGLLGAARPGCLTLMTGMHTGDVGLRVVLSDTAPILESSWEDVVEVSFMPHGELGMLVTLDGDEVLALELPERSYRVRYCARDMDQGKSTGVVMADESTVDAYELHFWPEPMSYDRVLRQGSDLASGLHREVSQGH